MKEKYSYLVDYMVPVIDKKYHTRSDAADDLGVDQAVLSRICSGCWFGVSEYIIENICQTLGLDPVEGVLRLSLCKNSNLRKNFFEIQKLMNIYIKTKGKGDYVSIPEFTNSDFEKFNTGTKPEIKNFSLVAQSLLPNKGKFLSLTIDGKRLASMGIKIPIGSKIVVNVEDCEASDSKIYMFKIKKKTKIGRVYIHDKHVSFDTEEIPKKVDYIFEKDNQHIIGRVVLIQQNH